MCSIGKTGPHGLTTTVRTPRPASQRRADAVRLLSTPAVDAWVATAGADGPYLVPLSIAWTRERIVLALSARSRTVRNLLCARAARLGIGPTRDVVMVDALVETHHDVADAPDLAAAYAAQADWDPRHGSGQVLVVLRPDRIQAWREADELAGRTLMRAGSWLV